MSSLKTMYENYNAVKEELKKDFSDTEIRDFWFIKGCKSLNLTDDEIEKIYRQSNKYQKAKEKICNGRGDLKKADRDIESVEKAIIELAEEHNAKKGNRKIFIGTYSYFPLRIYEVKRYTERTGRRYSAKYFREHFDELDSWFYAHATHTVYFD